MEHTDSIPASFLDLEFSLFYALISWDLFPGLVKIRAFGWGETFKLASTCSRPILNGPSRDHHVPGGKAYEYQPDLNSESKPSSDILIAFGSQRWLCGSGFVSCDKFRCIPRSNHQDLDEARNISWRDIEAYQLYHAQSLLRICLEEPNRFPKTGVYMVQSKARTRQPPTVLSMILSFKLCGQGSMSFPRNYSSSLAKSDLPCAGPSQQNTDAAVIFAIQRVHLKSIVRNKGGVDTVLDTDSFSYSQRQLFCLARTMTILGKSKAVILDGNTSNVDIKSGGLM
ncbi:uncharacterized protein RSE6_01641 [Rhynchosporium secalis]|uniref:Uncharacterized protein n=1 Tax=Rhynchosporium secalis TaxID=38038 RepID=A0A1E1LYA5_RHYSE|nr:uncharacterized protein RSE6_01641 [Rhynchosporium secalis]